MRASCSTRLDALTAEQAAALGRYRARWTAIKRSTEPADRDAAEKGVRLAYSLSGIAPPARFVWCESPVALARLAGRASRADGVNLRSAVVDRPRHNVAAAVGRRLKRRVRAMVESTVNAADSLVASAAEAVHHAVPQEEVTLLRYLREARPLSLPFALRTLLGRSGLRHDAAGQHDLAFLGAYEYLRNALGFREETAPLLGLWQVAMNTGWLQPHEHVCWLAERPRLLRGDPQNRLHCASGPALGFGDGWSVWAWKGVEVPHWLIEQPERITLAAIDGEENVQVRRCMIEIMTPERFVKLGGALRVAEDETGILWRKIWLSYDAWAAVEVINATPEADGTHKHYFLQVPPDMRTAREAVAWTYGLTPRAYSNLVVRT
jgi:hypothetical protein